MGQHPSAALRTLGMHGGKALTMNRNNGPGDRRLLAFVHQRQSAEVPTEFRRTHFAGRGCDAAVQRDGTIVCGKIQVAVFDDDLRRVVRQGSRL